MPIMSKKPSLQVWGGKRWDRKIYQPTNSINLLSKSLFPENDWFTKKSLDILELSLFLFDCFLSFSQCKYYLLQGHSQLWDRADLDTTFASLKSVYLNPKSNLRVGYILNSASILPSASFDPRSFTENLSLSKFLIILLQYFIIFG